MKHKASTIRFLGVIAVVALLSAACAPMPVNPPRVLPTESVFLPGVAVNPVVSESPLQPTAVLTSTIAMTPTAELTRAIPTVIVTPVPTVVGPTWEWVASTFKDGAVLAPGDPTRYTFQLAGEGNTLVKADCNFGTGTYQATGNSFSFGAIGTTKMACPPDSMDSAFLAQLRNAVSFAFEGDDLVLYLKDDAGTMRLRRAPGEVAAPAPTLPPPASPTPLPTDTPWPATETPVPPPTQTAEPTAPAPTTPTPLPVPPTPVLLGTPVPLPTAVEAAVVNPPLSGTSWVLVSLTANGQTIPPVGEAPVTLEIDPTGSRISGSAGCNQYRATLTRDAAGATIAGPALMTQKTCAANLMVEEVEFIDSLLRMRSYEVRGNELTLRDAAGKVVLVLARK